MKHYSISILVFLTILGPLKAQDMPPTHDQLRHMVLLHNDVASSKKAIDEAVKHNYGDVLVAASDNPNWDVKSYAVDAIGKLGTRDAAQALSSVLKKDALWADHVKGGEGEIAQDHFNTTLKRAILRTCGINTTDDLYDGRVRAKLIESLKSLLQIKRSDNMKS
ncbi:MAG: HEAT repeat domain-containing protein [Methylacidiphilales bacterium]|nr:HEAT repeat domain-containing protein [Candidatus Methylacidiphilales bacterium]